MFFFRKGALPSHQQERDTKGASGELAGCAAGELASTHGLLIFPIFYNFPLLFICLFLEDVIPVKLKLFDAFANVIECPTSKHTTLKKKMSQAIETKTVASYEQTERSRKKHHLGGSKPPVLGLALFYVLHVGD